MNDEILIKKFRNLFEDFILDFDEALRNVAKFEDAEIIKKFNASNELNPRVFRIHLIPDCKDAEWLVPMNEQLSKDLTDDREKLFRFKVRFMSLGLERRVEFERITWLCSYCMKEFETIVLRQTTENFRRPNYCINPKCKAKNKSDFYMVQKKSVSFEKRVFTVIDTENQEVINEIDCYISLNIDYFKEKAKNIRCNDEIEVLGILKMDISDLESKKEIQLPVYYIEVLDINSENLNNVNLEVIKQIRIELGKDPLYCNKIFDSIHPYSQNIINFFPIKLLYGASFITSDSYTEIRNGINSIVAGHSGTQKSKIGTDFKRKLSANNFGIIFGKNTTAKGLVPVAQRNSNEKNLVKRYGAIPYYNKKTFLVDEAHYMYAKDPDALECFKCYEEGIISRALDGTTITAEAKGTVIFALNYKTKDEAYDFDKSLEENLGFPEDQKSVLDRFDAHYRIPRNSKSIVKLLKKRGKSKYIPKFLVPNEIIFNYFIEAKRIYSTGVTIPPNIDEIIDTLYDAILETKKENVILNPREPEILNKFLRVIAAMRLRDIVNENDIEYLKKYLINTIIPFQDNPYLRKIRTIDMDEIFKNAFDLLAELYGLKFSISDFIEFLISYLGENYFPHNFKDKDEDVLGIEQYISTDKTRYNLTNHQFKELLDKNVNYIKDAGYIVDKYSNKTHFIKKDFATEIIRRDCLEIFKDNNFAALEIKNLAQVLEHNTSFSTEFIGVIIGELVNSGVLVKTEGEKVKYNK